MTRIALAAALLAALLALGPAPAIAGGPANDGTQDDAFARAIAAYDAGRYGQAVEIWTRLSGAGIDGAAAALAGLYRQGLGVARDPARAAALYRRAGLRGHVIAQLNLGEMLERGEGRARDRAAAWAWYRIAGEGGNGWAETQAKRIWAALAPKDRGRARARLAAIKTEIGRHR